jgi:hypothetical protein
MPDWRSPINCLARSLMSGYMSGDNLERWFMGTASQERALRNYRNRLTERGMTRFEVLGLASDRMLIRSLARRLAEDGPEAMSIRATVTKAVEGEASGKGRIFAALRRSPLVGADIDLNRGRVRERDSGL